MTRTLVQFDFPFDGPWGDGLEAACKALATDIATEPGLIWKLWGENEAEARASGVYLFTDPAAADSYIERQSSRLRAYGVTDPTARRFRLHVPLSRTTWAPV